MKKINPSLFFMLSKREKRRVYGKLFQVFFLRMEMVADRTCEVQTAFHSFFFFYAPFLFIEA